jgi:DNA uptake protein ComE-like DNA-binding protein
LSRDGLGISWQDIKNPALEVERVSLSEWIGRWVPSQNQHLQDPYYRFQSLAELRRAASLGMRLDVNRATVDDWLRLPGLSIHQARTLVELSQAGVAFYCLEDLAAALGLPLQRLQPLAPVLRFCHYDSFDSADDLGQISPVNPNRASLEQLMQIPGLELTQAQAVLRERQRGVYQNLSDLQRRLQWSGPTLARLMHYLRC